MHEQMVPCMRPQDDNRRSNSENLGSANENLFSSLLKKLTEAELVRFSMRQHICLGRYMLLPIRLSAREVDHGKTVEVRIMKFSPYCSPILLVFVGKFHPQILRVPPSGGVKQGRGG